MRTQPPRIVPCCSYCNWDHDPDIECRLKPEGRGELGPERQPVKKFRELVRDANGKTIAVKEISRRG